jgi:hypothetical protein
MGTMSRPWTPPEHAGHTRDMTDGLVLPPGAGLRIQSAGMTLKVGIKETGRWSVFEADVAPGFDVGAHVHAEAEELFYILEGGTGPACVRAADPYLGQLAGMALPGRGHRPARRSGQPDVRPRPLPARLREPGNHPGKDAVPVRAGWA